MPGPDQGPRDPVCREMTVANIRDRPGSASIQVRFLESPRIYNVHRDHRSFARILNELRKGLAAKRPVRVTFPSIESDAIDAAWLT